MSHEFDLIVTGLDIEADAPKLDAIEDRLGDMTFAVHAGVVRVAVERPAASLLEAIRSAIEDVEAISGVRVVRVEPDDLVSQATIAQRLGRSRASISQLVSGRRGPGSFPPPAFESGRVALWRWSSVASWLEDAKLLRRKDADGSSSVIGAVNAVLEARRMVDALRREERASLSELLTAPVGSGRP